MLRLFSQQPDSPDRNWTLANGRKVVNLLGLVWVLPLLGLRSHFLASCKQCCISIETREIGCCNQNGGCERWICIIVPVLRLQDMLLATRISRSCIYDGWLGCILIARQIPPHKTPTSQAISSLDNNWDAAVARRVLHRAPGGRGGLETPSTQIGQFPRVAQDI